MKSTGPVVFLLPTSTCLFMRNVVYHLGLDAPVLTHAVHMDMVASKEPFVKTLGLDICHTKKLFK